MTLLFVLLLVPLALGVGALVGWRCGPIVGIATCLGVLAAGAVGYFGILVLALPM